MRFLALAPILVPTAALAHPGDHSDAPWWHVLTQPDHLGWAVVIAAVAVVAWARWRA